MKKYLSILVLVVIMLIDYKSYATENKHIADDSNIIKNINIKFTKYLTIKSRFKQIDSLGIVTYGWFIFDRANSKARIEYDSKSIRIIINNNSIMFDQIKLNEKSFTPLDSSPFKYIMRKDTSLYNNNLKIYGNISLQNNNYLITMKPKDSTDINSIIFDFNKKTLLLSGWTIIGNNDSKTLIKLIKPQFSNKIVPSYIFNVHKISIINYDSLQ